MADLDIARSLRWHDPGRFNGYVLSQHVAGTPVDVVNLRDALPVVKEISSWHRAESWPTRRSWSVLEG
jgi:hypothetical protein